jgi:hypothetical protein
VAISRAKAATPPFCSRALPLSRSLARKHGDCLHSASPSPCLTLRRRLARESGDGVVEVGDDVHALAVGAHRDVDRAVERLPV